MAIALANSRDGEGLTAKASPEGARSRLAAFDNAQAWTGTERGDSWGMCQPMLGHVAQVVVRVNYEGIPVLSGFSTKPVLPLSKARKTWRGLNCAPSFSRNSHRLPVLPRSSRSGSVRSLAQTRTHSSRNRACKPFARRQSLPTQQILQSIADRRHVSNLSKPRSSAGFKTSQKGLQGRGKVIRERGIFSQRGRHD